MCKNNLRGITLAVKSIWEVHSLTLIFSCCNEIATNLLGTLVKCASLGSNNKRLHRSSDLPSPHLFSTEPPSQSLLARDLIILHNKGGIKGRALGFSACLVRFFTSYVCFRFKTPQSCTSVIACYSYSSGGMSDVQNSQ